MYSYPYENEIITRARQIANDYYSLYGTYPLMIGVHTDHLRYMRTYEVMFAKMERVLPMVTPEIDYNISNITRVFCRFSPIYGLPANDVYVQLPELPGLKSGEALHRMASSEYDEKYRRCI